MDKLKGVLTIIIILLLSASCTQQGEKKQLYIEDRAKVLDHAAMDTLNKVLNKIPLMAIVTEDTVAINDLSAVAEREFAAIAEKDAGFASVGVLVFAATYPNIAIIKMGTFYDGIEFMSLPYASQKYYEVQIDDSFSTQQKVLTLANIGGASANLSGFLYSQIKEEILGGVSSVIAPSDRFIYQYVVHPFQLPVICLLQLGVGFYWAFFLYVLLCFAIYYTLRRVLREKYRRSDDKGRMQIQYLLPAIATFVYDVPIIVGGLSLASCLSIRGVEFFNMLVTNVGLSAQQVDSLFRSTLLSGQSFWLSVIGTIFCTFIMYLHGEDKNKFFWIKVIMITTILFWSNIAVNICLLLYFLPMLITCKKITETEIYVEARVKGLGKAESLLFAFLNPLGLVIGTVIGFSVGEHATTAMWSQMSNIHTNGSDTIISRMLVSAYSNNVKKDSGIFVAEQPILIDTADDCKTYKFTLQSNRKNDNVFIFFDAMYDGNFNTVYGYLFSHVKRGRHELSVKLYGKYELVAIKGFGVKDDSLAQWFETSDSCSFKNVGKEIIGYVMEYTDENNRKIHSKSTLEPNSIVRYSQRISINNISFYRLP